MIYKKVWNYVVKNFTYEDDPVDEQLTAPKYLIDIKKGDCDDFALFIKTALTVLGIETNYLVAGETENNFTHIVVRTKDGIILDGTNDRYNYLDEKKYPFQSLVIL